MSVICVTLYMPFIRSGYVATCLLANPTVSVAACENRYGSIEGWIALGVGVGLALDFYFGLVIFSFSRQVARVKSSKSNIATSTVALKELPATKPQIVESKADIQPSTDALADAQQKV
jgi:hypothetical protein